MYDKARQNQNLQKSVDKIELMWYYRKCFVGKNVHNLLKIEHSGQE